MEQIDHPIRQNVLMRELNLTFVVVWYIDLLYYGFRLYKIWAYI